MKRTGTVLAGLAAWLVTVVTVGALVWITVTSLEDRSGVVALAGTPVPRGAVPSGVPAHVRTPPAPAAGAGTGRPDRPGSPPGVGPAPTGAAPSTVAGRSRTPSPSPAPARFHGPAAGPDPWTATSSSAGPFPARGGQILLYCSPSGILDLRANAEPGWSGRWARTGGVEVIVWFTRGGETDQVTARCEGGGPRFAENPPSFAPVGPHAVAPLTSSSVVASATTSPSPPPRLAAASAATAPATTSSSSTAPTATSTGGSTSPPSTTSTPPPTTSPPPSAGGNP